MKVFKSRGLRKLLPLRKIFKQSVEDGVAKRNNTPSVSLPTVAATVPGSDEPHPPNTLPTGDNLVDQTVMVLINAGLYHHFCARNKSEDDCRRIVQRCSKFILWSYRHHHDDELDPTSSNVTNWFKALTNQHYSLMLAYSTYLQDYKQYQPSTIKNWIGDIQSCFQWATLFAPPSIKQPMSHIEGIKTVASIARSNQSKLQRKKRSALTLQELVRIRKLPAGGLVELQTAVLSDMPWARRIRSVDMDDNAYAHFMQLLFAAVYVFSPNGRQSGVMDMKLSQAGQLLTHKYAASTKFKTHHKYGFQPVTLHNASFELFQVYLNTVRPQVQRATPGSTEESLWIKFDGTAITNVGKLVKRYFVRKLNVGVTTTTIRSLVETEVDQLHKRGRITTEQKESVQNINGHTSETTRAYYLMEDRAADVQRTKGVLTSDIDTLLEVFATEMTEDEMQGPQEEPPAVQVTPMTVTQPAPPPTPPAALPQAPVLDWGTIHPDYNTTKPTATWTIAEKHFVGTWCANFRQEHPGSSNAVAKCLKHIQAHPEAISIFHQYHTLDCTRLRNGLRQYEKDKEREAEIRDVHPDQA